MFKSLAVDSDQMNMARTRVAGPRSLQLVLSLAILTAFLVVVPSRASFADSYPQVWVQGASLPSGYTARWDPAATAFPPLSEIVLFGGAPTDIAGSWYNDTWIYSTTTGKWTLGPPAPSGLTPRGGMAMAYHDGIGKIVMFGGSGKGVWPPYTDTWLFDGISWTKGPAAPIDLTGRTGARMVYDKAIGKIVLFGGTGTTPLNDTWLFNGTSWAKGPTAPAGLLPRAFFGMTYDESLKKVVVAGGDGGTDVWYFDGTTWTRGPDLSADIGARDRVALAYHPYLGASLLFGGRAPGNSNNVLYVLKDGAWNTLAMKPLPRPNSRLDPLMVWDPVNDVFLVFAGVDDEGNGATAFKDNWRVVSPPMTMVPASGPSGTAITVDSGPGWPPGGVVTLKIDSGLIGTLTVNANGQVHGAATITGTCPKTKAVKLSYDPWKLMVQQNFQLVCRGSSPLRSTGTAGAARVGSLKAPQPATRVRYGSTPPRATGTITAKDGRFYVGGTPILLHGIDVNSTDMNLDEADYDTIQSWNMNVVRLWVQWDNFEPDPPVNIGGKWSHTWDPYGRMANLKAQIGWASARGIYVVVENYCGPPCYGNGWPDWLYDAPYNSHKKNYTDAITASTDYWTDPLQQQFTKDWLSWLGGQLASESGVAGYEVLNEPQTGTYVNSHATTQMILDFELQLATTVRAVDPTRTIFFMTHDAAGAGLPNADLSGWTQLGNVALDLHDYFGGRWGAGLNLNPTDPSYGEILQSIYCFTLDPTVGPYLGTTITQMRMVQAFQGFLGGAPGTAGAIPLFIGEFGGRVDVDPNLMTFFGTTTQAFNLSGASWTAMSYTGRNDVFKDDGSLQPWVEILKTAAAYKG